MAGWTIGIIGGSGLYDVEGVEDAAWIEFESPWGRPSDHCFVGRVGHVRVASFLATGAAIASARRI